MTYEELLDQIQGKGQSWSQWDLETARKNPSFGASMLTYKQDWRRLRIRQEGPPPTRRRRPCAASTAAIWAARTAASITAWAGQEATRAAIRTGSARSWMR